MTQREAQSIVLALVLGLGATATSCLQILGADKDFEDLTSSSSGEATRGTGGAGMTTSSSSAGGMTTGQGSSQGSCGDVLTTTTTSTSTSSSSTGSGGDTPCGPGGPLTDSFTGATLDVARWGKYEMVKATVTQANDQIIIFNPGTPTASAGILSKNYFPFQGCSASIKVLDTPNLTEMTAFFVLSVDGKDTNKVAFAKTGSSLSMEVRHLNCVKDHVTISYDKDLHVYWRFRESPDDGGTVYWETSVTGAVWKPQHEYRTANLGFPIDKMKANFGVYSNGSVSGDTAIVDDFNVIP